MANETTEVEWWQAHGYLAARELEGGLSVCLARMVYTYRVMVCDEGGVYQFCCYPLEDISTAIVAWSIWDGTSEPVEGYTRWHR